MDKNRACGKKRLGRRQPEQTTAPTLAASNLWGGMPGRNRTRNHLLRRQVLYPLSYGHTKVRRGASLLVGVRGFEPPTSCSQSRRATGLRYTPKIPLNIPVLETPGQTGACQEGVSPCRIGDLPSPQVCHPPDRVFQYRWHGTHRHAACSKQRDCCGIHRRMTETKRTKRGTHEKRNPFI